MSAVTGLVLPSGPALDPSAPGPSAGDSCFPERPDSFHVAEACGAKAVSQLVGFAAAISSLFNTGSPSVYADIDRLKAEKVGLTPTDVFSTLQVYLGGQYVNDFNYLGRAYQVRVQADGEFRRTAQDIARLKARNSSGEMVPIGTVAQLKSKTIPYRVPRYNLFPAAEVQGVAAPGVATGIALHRMEELAHQVLPEGHCI